MFKDAHNFSVRRVWKLVALFTAIGLLAGLGIAITAPPKYASTHRLFVSTPIGSSATELQQGGSFTQSRVKSYVDVVRSDAVLGPAAAALKVPGGPEELRRLVEASVRIDTVVLSITATTGSPTRSAEIANAVAASASDVLSELDARSGSQESPIKVSTIDVARPEHRPVAPRRSLIVITGIVLGFVAGCIASVAWTLWDKRIRDLEGLESVTDLPVLASVPSIRGKQGAPTALVPGPSTEPSEVYRQLRTNLRFIGVDRKLQSLVVTSSVPNEGKSTTAVNLAHALAELELRVLLVDADLRRPTVSTYLQLPAGPGLVDVLNGSAPADVVIQSVAHSSLDVLPSGAIPPNPSEYIDSESLSRLLEELSAQYDMVILDAPPVLPVADALALAVRTDGVLLVARDRLVQYGQVAAAIDRLSRIGAVPVGVVFNAAHRHADASSGYYYGYGDPARQPDTAERTSEVPSAKGT